MTSTTPGAPGATSPEHSAAGVRSLGAFDGIVVADFSRVLAGPLASMFLADLGADVIKVERPGAGDDTRQWGPPYVNGMSTYFMSVNRNKRSIALDLADDADLVVARQLVERADVVIENFKRGSLARFSLDAPTVLAEHPETVYCSISGYGSGAGSSLPGYDFVIQAAGGLMSITGSPEGEPTKAGVALVDVLTGLHATVGIAAALHERTRSGRGQHVEVNLMSSLLSSLVNQASAYVNAGVLPGRKGNQHPSIAPYETITARDAPLALAVGNDRQFQALARELGVPELAADARFATNAARVANRDELVALLGAVVDTETAQHWTARLNQIGVPCAPVNDIAQAIALATDLELDPIVTFDDAGSDAVRGVASPIRLSATPPRYHRRPPEVGADSDDVRAWLQAGAPAR